MEPLDIDADPRVVGPFELLAKLGQGGMGVAYVARGLSLENLPDEMAAAYRLVEADDDGAADQPRLVVVKMIQAELLEQPQARERFSREIDAVRAVVSDRVPALRGADPEAVEPWFAMDYVEGPDLFTMVKKSGALGAGPCAALGLALVEAMRAIHGTGLLHRDLKPQNVVLGPDGPVVLDFGLATLIERRTSQALTKPGEAWGTWPYTSYEQLHSFAKAKEPTDVYALGATLLFALTGRPPYPHQPLLTPPDWSGVDSLFLPLLGQILVHTASQRPDLDGVETGLRAVLVQAGLTPEIAGAQLGALVAGAGLTPEFPPGVLADHADPEVRERAQAAVDAGAAPDAPWADGGAAHQADDDPGFYGLVDTDEIERAADAADAVQAQPGEAPPHPSPEASGASGASGAPEASATPGTPGDAAPDPGPTSYHLQPPQPPEVPPPPTPEAAKAPPRAAQKVAARLREVYAHSGTL
ncbi:serine/threonine protein kinase [Streptomyces sp. ID01-12c]|uniref:serine/threonine-protein kinase n=2 Tax=Streptomyces caniscabiei TaxID=2746961 RepID=UPI00177E7197|nr:serine/threonine-protein kinase [Streptomyces caniscabiei]MBD9703215.1 serine/threonine protein kinase [Streptomyces caniscabiei]MDX3732850.1 serine/threonine-protein kinase [Streptomyces caniscabiei]